MAASGYLTVNTLGSGFAGPSGVAVDAADDVFVADTNNNAVKEILALGGYTTVNAIGSGYGHPHGVALDASGNVYVGDYGNNAVKEVLAAGGYTAVNTLGAGYLDPAGVAVDASGDVLIADSGSNSIVKLDYTDAPTLNFAATKVGSASSDSPQTVTISNIGTAALTYTAADKRERIRKPVYAWQPCQSMRPVDFCLDCADFGDQLQLHGGLYTNRSGCV